MMKVAARNKFSRKTSIPSKPHEPNALRKNTRNRSSIMINGQTYQEYFQFVQTENIIESNDTTKNNLVFEKPANTQKIEESSFAKKLKIKKTISINPFQQQFEKESRSSGPNKKFNRLTNTELSRIKFHENEDKKSQKTMKQSKSSKNSTPNSSVRTSAIRKTGNRFLKTDVPLLRNSLIKKASIFHNTHVIFGKESEHYQDFLKESNLFEFAKTKKSIKENQKEEDSERQMKDQVETQSKSKFLIQTEPLAVQKEERRPKTQDERRSNRMMKSSLSRARKTSQNDLQFPKDYEPTYKQIFQSLTQKNIQQKHEERNIKFNEPYEENAPSQEEQQGDKQSTIKKQEQLKRAEQERIEEQRLYKEQTEELFRKLEREIAAKLQLERFEKKSNNYYEELRLKLTKKYDQISRDYKLEEKEKDKIGLLIEGCNLERHRRVNNFYFEKKQFMGVRPDTAGAINEASKDINRLNFVSKQRNKTIMRPQTSRPKSCSRTKVKLSYQKSSHMISDYVTNNTGMLTQRDLNSRALRKTYNKLSDEGSEYIFSMTNPDLKSHSNLRNFITQRSEKRLSQEGNCTLTNLTRKNSKENVKKEEKQNLATKFDTLLGICDEEQEQHEDTKNKMRVFQYYCNKMDNGFEKLSQRIQDYVAKL